MIQVFAQTGPDKNIDPAETAPDQGLPCLPFRLHVLDTLLYDKTTLFKFYENFSNVTGA